MKNILFILLFIPAFAYSQIGIKIGGGISNFTGYSHDYARSIGITKNFKIKKVFSIQSEVLYSVKSASKSVYLPLEMKDSITLQIPGNYNFTYNIHYLEIPILARLEYKNFFFNAGFAPSFNIFTNKFHGIQSRTELYESITFKFFDVPFITSFGYQMPISQKETLFFELRNSFGITKLINDSHVNSLMIYTGIYF